MEDDSIRLESCSICGRYFSETALARHENICAKVSKKTRKVFDSSKKRVEGTDIPTVSFKKHQEPDKGRPQKKSNWRETHEQLVSSLRAARGVTQAIKAGKPLPPPPPPTINPDYIQCDFCGRRFNESAAERHIEFCKKQQERIPKGRGHTVAAQKQATRINYQPPSLKGRKSGTSVGRVSYEDAQEDLRNTRFQAKPESGNSRLSSHSNSSKTINSNGMMMGNSTAGSRGPVKGAGYPPVNNRSANTQDRVPSGPALRTGRTAQTYNETKQLSAKQRAAANSSTKRYSSSDSLSPQYQSPILPSSHSQQWTAGSNNSGDYRTVGRGRAPAGRGTNSFGSGGLRVNGGTQNYATMKLGGNQRLPATTATNSVTTGPGKFCYECGSKFPTSTSKFCCECGAPKSG